MSLKFIHIPRTGGTSIEDYYIKHNIKYGRFDNDYCSQSLNRPNIWKGTAEKWHSILPDDSTLWQNYKFFIIVRNPIDRLISEYYQPYQHKKTLELKSQENVVEFNKNLKHIFNLVKNNPNCLGHHVPQIRFLNLKYLDRIYILDFSKLESEIMTVHNLFGIHTGPLKTKSAHSIKKRFNFKDLSKDTLDMFYNTYILDINLYQLISHKNNADKHIQESAFDKVFNIC